MNCNTNNRIMRHVPNALTLARLAMTVIFLAIVLCAGGLSNPKPAMPLLIAFILFVTAGLTDIADGEVARRYNVTSRFGRMIDPLVDKILICGTFLCFAALGQPRLAGIGLSESAIVFIRWSTAAILIARELLVQIRRQIAEARGVSFGAVWSGKMKMFVQSFGIGTVLIGWAFVSRPWGDWFTLIIYLIVIYITVHSGVHSFTRPIKKQ